MISMRGLAGFRPKNGSAEAARAALAATEAARAAARQVIAELEADRGAVLLDGTGAEIAEIEGKIAEGRAEAERLAAMAAAMPARIAAAEARERAAGLDLLAAEGEREAADGAALMSEIMAAIEKLWLLVQQHDVLAERVHVINRELLDHGRERVIRPLKRAWPNDPGGEVPYKLAPYLRLPGPRGACSSLAEWQADVKRAMTI